MDGMSKAICYVATGIGNFAMMMPAIQVLHDLSGSPVDIFIPDSWKDDRKPAIEEIAGKWPKVGKVIHWPSETLNVSDYQYWFRSYWNESNEGADIFKKNMKQKQIPLPDWRESLIHEVDYYMEIMASMGYLGPEPKVDFPVANGPVLDLPRPIIAFSNGALKNKYWAKKYWPGFGILSDTLKAFSNASIVGIGAGEELDGVKMDQNFVGKLSITETAKVLSQIDLLITNDTGVEKIADVMGIPIIAIFGPTLTSKVAPRNGKSIVVKTKAECAPCQGTEKFKTCEDNACMKTIGIGDVMSEVRRYFKKLNRRRESPKSK
jgi:hypothetical protein